MLTKRQRMILETILNNPPGITGENLAARIGVSSRTIRNEVNEINMDKTADGLIHASRRKGYFIPHELEERAGKLIREEDSTEEAQDRIYRILVELLMAEKLDLYQLGEDMNLAQPTIYKEAAKLKRLLHTVSRTDVFHLGTEQIWLQGTEEEIRLSVFEFLKNRMQIDFGNTVLQIRKIFQKVTDQDEYDILVGILKNYFEENEIQISDGNLLLIAIVIFFSLMRNQAGKRVAGWEAEESIQDEEIQKLISFLKENGYELDQGDCAVMLPLLHTMKLTPAKSRNKEISQESRLILDEFCREVLDKYNLDLYTLGTLLDSILFHIEYMLRRLDTGYEIQNPIMNEVKKQYLFAYEIAMLIVPIIYRYKGIFLKDDEVAYIAVFIEDFLKNANTKLKTLIISSGRMSINSIIEHWIQMNFGNLLQVMDCIPAYQLENYEKNHEVDLLITTSQNPAISSIPTYKFEGVPDTDSLDIMNAIIRKLRIGRKYKGIIERFFSPGEIRIYQKEITFERIIYELSAEFEKNNKIYDHREFMNDILQREINYPTVIGESMMIPHPLITFAIRTSVAVAVLKKPLRYHNKEISLIFILAIEGKHDNDVSMLFQLIKRIALERGNIKNLVEAENAKEFLERLVHISNYA